MTPSRCFATLVLGATLLPGAHAAVVYNEAVSGDLSNSGLSPTFVSVALGSNQVFGATGNAGSGTDRDYFTFTVPIGQVLSGLTVQAGTVPLGLAFLGLQSGTQVTAPTGGPATLLLGWTHYASADIGSNILPRIGTGAGAIGFVGALGAGSYAVWIQDFNAGSSPYSFDFTLAAVPEPAPALTLLAGLAALTWLRRRRC